VVVAERRIDYRSYNGKNWWRLSMADIALVAGYSGVECAGGVAPERAGAKAPAQSEASRTERPSDRVDISDRARLLSKLSAMPDVRSELVDRIRQEIAQGTYETEDRLDQAIENLAEDLDSQS
jgi:negative regulator of flagellin synthesis FlgM